LRGALGVEDFVNFKEQVVIGSKLDLFHLTSPSSAQKGFVLIYPDTQNPSRPLAMKELSVENLPKQVELHTHGLGLFEERLFVVNHGYQKGGGERILAFNVQNGGKNDDYKLDYEFSIDFTDIANGALNDVTAISSTEFYVTQYLPFPHPIEGAPIEAYDKLPLMGYLLSPLRLQWTKVFHCQMTPKSLTRSSVTHWKEVCTQIEGASGVMLNGITNDPNQQVFIVDAVTHDVQQYWRDPKSGALELLRIHHLPYSADNAIWSNESIILAGISHLPDCFFKFAEYYQKHPDPPPKGGPTYEGSQCPGHVTVLDPMTGKMETIFQHDGSKLGGISGAVQLQGKHLIVGSFGDDGVLICPIKN